MVLRRAVIAVLATATMALSACGLYADSNGQVCVIVIGIPICQTA